MQIYAKFQKSSIDPLRRTVTGIAQLEGATPDLQNDIVDFDASLRAFKAWPGNVREMHVNKAVGKRVAWWADPINKQIFVRTAISKGAEDTWQKILDGVLTGYSIGGHALRQDRVSKSGRTHNRITDYVITELSLVDSPANPHCRITAIHKRNGIMVADNVLGIQGGSMNGNEIQKSTAATAAIKEFARTLAEGEELVLIKRTAIVPEGVGDSARAVLQKDASLKVIRKDDLDAGGYTSEGDSNDSAPVDVQEMANQAALLHKDICAMGGIDDAANYASATGDGTNNGGGADATGGAGDGGGFGKRFSGLTAQSITKLVNDAVGKRDEAISKRLDDIVAAIGPNGANAIRKEAGAGNGSGDATTTGSPISKVSDLSAATQNLGGGDAQAYADLKKREGELKTEMDGLIAKMEAKQPLTPQEHVRREQVGVDISKVRTELMSFEKLAIAGRH